MKATNSLLRTAWCLLFLVLNPWVRAQIPVMPTVEIVAPQDGAAYPSGQDIKVAVRVTGAGMGDWTRVVVFADQVRIGDIVNGPAIPPGGGELPAILWKAPAPGTHILHAQLSHNAMELPVYSKRIIVQVGKDAANQPPRVVLTEPKAGAIYAPGDVISIVGETTDPDGYVPHFEYYVDGQKIGEESIQFFIPPAPGQVQQFKWPWQKPLAGMHEVAVVVSDDQGASSKAMVQVQVGSDQPPGLPVVSIEATLPATGEPCPVCRFAPGTFTLRRTGDPKAALAVWLAVAGTATPGLDYDKIPNPVEFPAGEASMEIRVGAFDDLLVEGDETVVVELTYPPTDSLPFYTVDAKLNRAVVTIHDDDSNGTVPIVSVEASRAETREPFLCKTRPCPLMPEPAPAQFLFRRKGGNLDLPLTIPLEFSGTAENGTDYAKVVPGVTFPAGADAVWVDIAAFADEVIEGDETVVAQILVPPSLPDGLVPYRVTQSEAKVVIHDFTPNPNPVPVVGIEATQPVTSEGCPACLVLPGVFTITRTGSTAAALEVFMKYSGTATAGLDYEKLPEIVQIPAGKSSAQLVVVGRMDALAEGTETVVAEVMPDPSLGPIPNYTVDPNRTAAKIQIDDMTGVSLAPTVSVTLSRDSTSECPSGVACKIAPVEIQFHRTGPETDNPLTVFIGWKGTAKFLEDFGISDLIQLPAHVTFPAGKDTTTLLLYAINDCVIEDTEEVVVTVLPDPTMGPMERYRVSSDHGSATVQIYDGTSPLDDTVPVIAIQGTGKVLEYCPPNADCIGLGFTLTRSGGSLKQPLEVNVAYGGTATPGVDYTKLPATVTFAPGEATAYVSGSPLNDELVEGDETVVATLVCSDAAVPGYRISGKAASATAVILDDDQPAIGAVVEILAPKDGSEFADPSAIQFVARTLDPKGAITRLDWFDGELPIGTSEILFIREPDPGTEIRHEFSWQKPPVGDHKVRAVGTTAAGERVQDAVLVRVLADGGIMTIVTVGTGVPETTEVPPGSKRAVFPATFVLKRSGDAARPLRVQYTVGGSARNGRDYGFLDGDATFAAGETERTIEVFPITDELIEGDETVELSLVRSPAYAVGLPGAAKVVIHDAQQPEAAFVHWTEPRDGTWFDAGADIRLAITTVDPAGFFGSAEFYADGKLIGTAGLVLPACVGCEPKPGTPIPFEFVWKNAAPGEHTLTAIATSWHSASTKVSSAPLRIVVGKVGAGSVVSRALPDAYQAGVAFTVTLDASPADGAGSYGIEDHPPKGWVVSNIATGGAWDEAIGAVKFGPFLDGTPRKLSYDVLPPVWASGRATFTGWAAVDGVRSVIGGDSVTATELKAHPADGAPANWSLSLEEVTAYGAAWKKGGEWATGPNPIPIDFVTRAGALWRGGEAYTYDPTAGPAPICWVNTAEGGVRPVVLDVDLPPADLALNLEKVRALRSFAFAERISGDAGVILRIRTVPGAGVRVQAVEQPLPPGIEPIGITEGGTFDATHGVIRWGPFYDDTPRTLTATLDWRAPALVGGVASFDGESVSLGASEAVAPGAAALPRIAQIRRLADGTTQLFLVDSSAAGCVLEYSDDLNTWHRIGEAAAGVDCQVQHDTDANESAHRFYRAMPKP